ncbi:transcriptional regulator [Vibrio zhanjiangensis]|uniref:Transcriptional regulator n=1 Tax=Vibrio zhanjiangensis TaxID=1046128 RepID=A0ABQ6F308_9VIBR|nr:HU family DNA-binding protein [Vibrio zhanjiangensis]GLT19584.1 transcriptional regulator [Vibrio zhanjiangensis]
MNKSSLIDAVAKHANLTKKQAGMAIESMTEAISHALANGDEVTLVGFGSFKTTHRAARAGRNPKTGETLEIKASTVPAFKPGKALKDACNP